MSRGQAWGRLAQAALGKESSQAGRARRPYPQGHTWPAPGSPALQGPASTTPRAGDTVPHFPPPGPPRHTQPWPGMDPLPPPLGLSISWCCLRELPFTPFAAHRHNSSATEPHRTGTALSTPRRAGHAAATPARGEETVRSKQAQAMAPTIHPQPTQARGNKKAPKRVIPCSLQDSQAVSWAPAAGLCSASCKGARMLAALGTRRVRSLP